MRKPISGWRSWSRMANVTVVSVIAVAVASAVAAIVPGSSPMAVVTALASDHGARISPQIEPVGERQGCPGTRPRCSGDTPHVADATVSQSPASEQAAPPAQEELGRIHIEYVPPKKPALQKTYEAVKDRRVLERLKEIFSPFRLPEILYIKALECDSKPNTRFDREEDRPTVKICYEYLKANHDRMPKKATSAGITPGEVIVGQYLFAAAHEVGHALFDIYNMPIFGRQEDAADQFATYFILQFGGERARRLILGAAYSYRGFVKQLNGNPKVTLPLAAFSSDHGQPEQRFYNLICIAYGYDPKLFAGAVDRKYLPLTRANVCKLEYQNLMYAVRILITPHIDKAEADKVIGAGFSPAPDPPAKAAPQSAK